MTLPTGYEYGFRANLHDDVWCIRRAGADLTLCRRTVNTTDGTGYFPNQDDTPLHPKRVCERCREAMWGPVRASTHSPVVYGVCPVCGVREPTFEGRIQAHGGCAGVNMPPVVKR